MDRRMKIFQNFPSVLDNNNFFVEREGRGIRRALRNFDVYLLVRSPQKADPFPRWRNAGHASGSCLGENLEERIYVFAWMEEKESDSHLFFICSRDVLLFLGRRILSQRLLQGMYIYIYIYTFPLLFFSISRKRHVVKHASVAKLAPRLILFLY